MNNVVEDMKTLEEHNAEVHGLYVHLHDKNSPAGVKCESCNVEMLHVDINTVYTSNPPQQKVYCPKCNRVAFKVV